MAYKVYIQIKIAMAMMEMNFSLTYAMPIAGNEEPSLFPRKHDNELYFIIEAIVRSSKEGSSRNSSHQTMTYSGVNRW